MGFKKRKHWGSRDVSEMDQGKVVVIDEKMEEMELKRVFFFQNIFIAIYLIFKQ